VILDAFRQLHRCLNPPMPSVFLCFLSRTSRKQKKSVQFRHDRVHHGASGSLHVLFGHAYRVRTARTYAIRELRKAVALDTHTPHAHYVLGLGSALGKMNGRNAGNSPGIRNRTQQFPPISCKLFLATSIPMTAATTKQPPPQAPPRLTASWPEPGSCWTECVRLVTCRGFVLAVVNAF